MDSQMIVDLGKEKSLLTIKVRLVLLGNHRILDLQEMLSHEQYLFVRRFIYGINKNPIR